mmetsp:Transcript_54359/g.86919  ORF Transcript_54359/g.86919 Transcript_54359/m.86919 type:complete len:307 (+) Transcript_54359:3-923(+)
MLNVVVMENLPQLVIQIVFTATRERGNIPEISIIAAVTSVFSILVATIDHFSKRELRKVEVPSELFTFKITSQSISSKPSKFRNKRKTICRQISKVLILDETAVEVVDVHEYADVACDGLIVYFLVTTLKWKPDEIYEKLKGAVDNGVVDRQMNKAWNLGRESPHVSSLQWLQIQSAAHLSLEQYGSAEGAEANDTTTATAATRDTATSNAELLDLSQAAGMVNEMQKLGDQQVIVVKASQNTRDVHSKSQSRQSGDGQEHESDEDVHEIAASAVTYRKMTEKDNDNDNDKEKQEGDASDVQIEMV